MTEIIRKTPTKKKPHPIFGIRFDPKYKGKYKMYAQGEGRLGSKGRPLLADGMSKATALRIYDSYDGYLAESKKEVPYFHKWVTDHKADVPEVKAFIERQKLKEKPKPKKTTRNGKKL